LNRLNRILMLISSRIYNQTIILVSTEKSKFNGYATSFSATMLILVDIFPSYIQSPDLSS